ncbi:IclR family transcriptional regulator [Pseudonocardia sp. HH130630-07]|uniref:IclR family transcriptional regulator n=1 Tax=Pseudonocardia sp. HH130630-07 TaxID=1690815 RepID=UPI0008153551|nr:IclR family transcriptional regulator [Pseudonocardia sp. HH130630-07]ANY09025.1 IclR family transcriptional regulator [Pseudonocardia sp. HH130630-07]
MAATNSVVSAIRVLEAVGARQPIGLSELARAVGLPKSTVQRTLQTLAEVGWCRADDRSRWRLTYRAFAVGNQARDAGGLRERALPVLHELQLTTGETVHLAAPDGRELVLVERLDTAHRLRAFLPLGQRIPLHASATGQAFLAACPDPEIEDYLDGPLAPSTRRTVVGPDALRARLRDVRNRGWSVNPEGLTDGIAAVGAAIRGADGRPVGALSVSGPTVRMTDEVFDAHGRAAAEAAGRISRELGARD